MALQVSDRTPRSRTPWEAPGTELDREIERRVFGRASGGGVPPFSTQDWTAAALAQLVARRTGWSFDVAERDGIWSAIGIERSTAPSGPGPVRGRILSLVTTTGETRAHAICRCLLQASRSPRWPRPWDGRTLPGGEADAPCRPDLRLPRTASRRRPEVIESKKA